MRIRSDTVTEIIIDYIAYLVLVTYPVIFFQAYSLITGEEYKKCKNILMFVIMILGTLFCFFEYQNLVIELKLMFGLHYMYISFYYMNKIYRELFITFLIVINVFIYNVPALLSVYEIVFFYVFYYYFFQKNKLSIRNNLLFLMTVITLKYILYRIYILLFLVDFIFDYTFTGELIFYFTYQLFVSYLLFIIIKASSNKIASTSEENEFKLTKSSIKTLSIITHEIKNPIAVCRGYLDMIDLSKKQESASYIEIISLEINRAIDIMNEFINFANIVIEPEIMDFEVLIEDVVKRYDCIANKSGISINNLIDDDIYVFGDYKKLQQVMINVIKNSIEAIDIKKDSHYINIEYENIPLFHKIIISDNGRGMEEEVLEQIGRPFYTNKERGTGLGVAFVKDVINLHGGTVLYTSTIHIGTKVTIKLPKDNTLDELVA